MHRVTIESCSCDIFSVLTTVYFLLIDCKYIAEVFFVDNLMINDTSVRCSKHHPSLHSVFASYCLFCFLLMDHWGSSSKYKNIDAIFSISYSSGQLHFLVLCSWLQMWAIDLYLSQDNAISTRSTLFLLMANILNGMTHLSMDIQLTAFRFLELVVLNFPSSFPRYAEQVSGLLSCIGVSNVETLLVF